MLCNIINRNLKGELHFPVRELFEELKISVYRITRFASPDMSKAVEAVDSMRSELESAGADFIDIVSYDNGKGVVLAKYSSEAVMEAATEVSKNAFGKMFEQGIIDGDSIHPHTGVVISSI